MAKMYHIETFKPKGDVEELKTFLREEALPYWRSRGFEVRFYFREHGLGYGPGWFFTGMDKIGDIDGWADKAMGDDEGKRIMAKFQSLVEVVQASLITDIES